MLDLDHFKDFQRPLRPRHGRRDAARDRRLLGERRACKGGLFSGAVAGLLLFGLLAEHGHFAAVWVLCGVFLRLAALTVAATRRVGGSHTWAQRAPRR